MKLVVACVKYLFHVVNSQTECVSQLQIDVMQADLRQVAVGAKPWLDGFFQNVLQGVRFNGSKLSFKRCPLESNREI